MPFGSMSKNTWMGCAGERRKSSLRFDAFLADSRENLEKHGLWNEYMEALQAYDACEVRPGEFVRGWQKQARLNYMSGYFDCRFRELLSACAVPAADGDWFGK